MKILVTGGLTRVGKEITNYLVGKGHQIIATYHTMKDAHAESLADDLGCTDYRVDLTDHAAVVQLNEDVGPFSAIIHGAGFFALQQEPIEDIELAYKVMDTTIKGTFNLCNTMLFPDNGTNRLICLSDTSHLEQWDDAFAHTIAKGSLHNIVEYVVYNYGDRIQANSIVCGMLMATGKQLDKGINCFIPHIDGTGREIKEWTSFGSLHRTIDWVLHTPDLNGQHINIDPNYTL